MWCKEVSRSGILSCAIVYCVVFFIVRNQILLSHFLLPEGQPDMLLFILPGALSALTTRLYPLTVAMLGALLALPFCLILMVMGVMLFDTFWQAGAFIISAFFWCILGALSIMLIRTLLGMRR